jgi:O-antigen/teichoic acid export membrane protein
MPSSIHFQRVARNFAAHVLGQAMNGVYQVVSIPLYLHFWSKQMYGEWLVLFSLPSLLWSLEGGLAGVAVNRMTVAAAAGNRELVNAIFQNVLFMQGLLSVALLGAAVAVVSVTDLHGDLGFRQISGGDTSVIVVVLLVFMLAGFQMSLLRAAYRAAAIEARGIMANNLWRLSDFCVAMGVLILHGRPLDVAEAMAGVAVGWAILMYFDVRRICPQIEFGVARASWKLTRGILADGLPLLAGQAAAAFFLQGYPLVINRVLGASTVVTFATVRTVSRVVLLLIQVVSYSSAPEVSRSYGRKDWPTYLRLLKVMLAFALWGGVATLAVLPLAGPWLISVWTSGKVAVGHLPMLFFAVSIALQGLWGVGSIVLVCSNMHHLFNYIYLGITLAALGAADFALRLWGFPAVPGIMAVQDLALVIVVIALSKSKLTHISLRDLRPVFTIEFYRDKFRDVLGRRAA